MDKAGTTSLYQYLKKIPGVYMSPIKEPWYFAPVRRSMRKNPLKVKNEKDYLNLFKNVKNESPSPNNGLQPSRNMRVQMVSQLTAG